MKVIFLPTHYRIPAEIVKTRENGNHDIVAKGILIENVENRHLEMYW